MKEYTKRETQIIIAWAKECKFEGAFDLSKAEHIEDVQMFLDAEVCQIQAHVDRPPVQAQKGFRRGRKIIIVPDS